MLSKINVFSYLWQCERNSEQYNPVMLLPVLSNSKDSWKQCGRRGDFSTRQKVAGFKLFILDFFNQRAPRSFAKSLMLCYERHLSAEKLQAYCSPSCNQDLPSVRIQYLKNKVYYLEPKFPGLLREVFSSLFYCAILSYFCYTC